MGTGDSKYFYYFLAALFAVTLSFQGCGPDSVVTYGNGDPYEGMSGSPIDDSPNNDIIVEPIDIDGPGGSGTGDSHSGGDSGGPKPPKRPDTPKKEDGTPGAKKNDAAPGTEATSDKEQTINLFKPLIRCEKHWLLKLIRFGHNGQDDYVFRFKTHDGFEKYLRWNENVETLEYNAEISPSITIKDISFNGTELLIHLERSESGRSHSIQIEKNCFKIK